MSRTRPTSDATLVKQSQVDLGKQSDSHVDLNMSKDKESRTAYGNKEASGSSSSMTAVSLAKPVDRYTLPKRPWRPYVTPFETILAHKYKGSGTEADPYIVDWLPRELEDPQNWPSTYKWGQVFITSFLTLAVALSSSAFAGGVKSLMREFGGSPTLWTACVSLFVLGFAFGPLIWAPASEVFGRRPVYILSYGGLTLWQAVIPASPNIASVLVFRFLSGFFGSSPLTNSGGTVTDILNAQQRGIGMALFSAAPFLGPALGPISGGFIGDAAGWKWVAGFLGILCGVMVLVIVLVCPETYAPTLLRRRAATLSKATGNVYRYSADVKQPFRPLEMFKTSLIRPWLFLLEPIVLILSIYIAIIYGTLYLNFAAYPIIFQKGRGWSTGMQGLAFLGIAGGVLLAIAMIIAVVNKQYVKAGTAKEDPPPEARLPPAIFGGVVIVIGLGGFAATNGPNVHWIAPIMFGIPFGFGMVIVFLSTMGYLVDAYTIYAASVLAANSVLRSLLGAAFPLFTSDMYAKLGIHWAAALPGFLAFACIPFPILFYKYGAQIRARCKYAADAERTMKALVAARRTAEADEEAREGGDKGDELDPPNLGRIKSNVSAMNPEHPRHQEWSVYTILANRDEVDLSDTERMRLAGLRKDFAKYHHPAE